MEPLAATARTANLERLAQDQFDVLVIGGGITGAGVALDAATRGYRVALVEKVDFASGTSSKSTKLAHGGIRYLPQFDFMMIQEALVERGLMVRHAPFLVRPQPFVLPVYKNMRWPGGLPIRPSTDFGLGFALDIGLWMYDLMAGWLNIGVIKASVLRRRCGLPRNCEAPGSKNHSCTMTRRPMMLNSQSPCCVPQHSSERW